MDYFHVHASILSIFLVTPPSRLEIRCIWGLVLIQASRISTVYTALNGSLRTNPHLSNIPQSRPPPIPKESSVKELSGNLCLYWLPICQRFPCETSSLFSRFSLCGVPIIWIRFLPLFKCGSVSTVEGSPVILEPPSGNIGSLSSSLIWFSFYHMNLLDLMVGIFLKLNRGP